MGTTDPPQSGVRVWQECERERDTQEGESVFPNSGSKRPCVQTGGVSGRESKRDRQVKKHNVILGQDLMRQALAMQCWCLRAIQERTQVWGTGLVIQGTRGKGTFFRGKRKVYRLHKKTNLYTEEHKDLESDSLDEEEE